MHRRSRPGRRRLASHQSCKRGIQAVRSGVLPSRMASIRWRSVMVIIEACIANERGRSPAFQRIGCGASISYARINRRCDGRSGYYLRCGTWRGYGVLAMNHHTPKAWPLPRLAASRAETLGRRGRGVCPSGFELGQLMAKPSRELEVGSNLLPRDGQMAVTVLGLFSVHALTLHIGASGSGRRVRKSGLEPHEERFRNVGLSATPITQDTPRPFRFTG